MTSASELFYNRRSRIGRNLELGFDSVSERNPHLYSHRHNRHSNREDDCDSLRRPSNSRHLSQTEREPVRLDHTTSQPGTSNFGIIDTSSRTSRQRLRNDRLPGAVLQARERLSERLRGVSLPGNRQLSRASGIYLEFASAMLFTEDQSKKKPPGLSEEAINNLQCEVFSFVEGDVVINAGEECSICLEKFCEGDEMIRLSCEHRFHPLCLDPWVRTCGDCPYCRRSITVDYQEETKTLNPN
ncbi:RING/U-box superfamily protein [Tasmannia lanceolata]|uniref:RING/U-box superfamily protein n=1 Tax=Tasmannia lanceolata TaxID=3420 RepID=UPI00406304F2